MQTLMEWMGGYIWVTAFVLGAIHALQPGHGKTIVAAYLVGTKGTVKDAIFLGVVVTFTHTVVIYILAAFAQGGAIFFSMEAIESGLGAVASLLIVVVGLTLLRANWPAAGRGQNHHHHPDHQHHEGGHAHSHDHDHHHDSPAGHAHSHFPGVTHVHASPSEMTSLSKIFMLGVSGGIVPCPEGLAVFLASVAGGQMQTGLLLVMVFSLGLAGTLVVVGILFLKASGWLSRWDGGKDLGARISLVSAGLITVVGMIYLVKYAYLFSQI